MIALKRPVEKLLTVMLVDDNPIDNMISKKLLERTHKIGHIISYDNPRAALKYLDQLDNAEEMNSPDIIFLDINMPEMDGFKFLENYNKLPESTKENITVNILSSSENEWDIKRAKNNPDVKNYYVKPLDIKKLDI